MSNGKTLSNKQVHMTGDNFLYQRGNERRIAVCRPNDQFNLN